MIKYLLCWFPLLLIAVINGTARDLWYKKEVGELVGHQISTISLIVLFAFYMRLIIINRINYLIRKCATTMIKLFIISVFTLTSNWVSRLFLFGNANDGIEQKQAYFFKGQKAAAFQLRSPPAGGKCHDFIRANPIQQRDCVLNR